MRSRRVLGLVLLALLASSLATAEPWRFVVVPDTQWSPSEGHAGLGCATEIIDAVNQEAIRVGAKFVVAVGDLANNDGKGTPEALSELNIRAEHNAALAKAGIRFFPVRGNHDGSAAAATRFSEVFPDLPGTPGFKATDGYRHGTSPELPGLAGRSYAFTYRNATCILVDTFAVEVEGERRSYPVAEQQQWITAELQRAKGAGGQAFIFTHKNLLGQNHKDNFFGGPKDKTDPGDENPKLLPMQTELYRAMVENGARYVFSGHDHIYHHALVTTPALGRGDQVEQVICGSCSSKFYDPRPPFSEREQPLGQERLAVGFVLVTLDGPAVTVEYWSVPTDGRLRSFEAPEKWNLTDRFGSSLNGRSFQVKQGESFTTVSDQVPQGDGFAGSTMMILDGVNELVGTTMDDNPAQRRPLANCVATGWAPAEEGTSSDVLTLWGMRIKPGSEKSNRYVLALSYDHELDTGEPRLLERVEGRWVPVGNGAGSVGPYREGAPVGTWGIDQAKHLAWAVLDHDGTFAVGR